MLFLVDVTHIYRYDADEDDKKVKDDPWVVCSMKGFATEYFEGLRKKKSHKGKADHFQGN
jgi:hypothetical protein